ncbi:MAG: RNA-binding protein [Methanosarcinaceae archaeon]|nr:RNA-binding protein [Methanosarcinaceae archaeon]
MIHYIIVRATAHATEDVSRVREALDLFLPVPAGKSKDHKDLVDALEVQGHYGNPITMLSAKIDNKTQTSAVVKYIREHLSDKDVITLNKEIQERLDDDQLLFLRFNKQKAYQGLLELSSSSDAIVVRIKIATYPKNREKAMEIVEELLVPTEVL